MLPKISIHSCDVRERRHQSSTITHRLESEKKIKTIFECCEEDRFHSPCQNGNTKETVFNALLTFAFLCARPLLVIGCSLDWDQRPSSLLPPQASTEIGAEMLENKAKKQILNLIFLFSDKIFRNLLALTYSIINFSN